MDQTELYALLGKIGKRCFVEYYRQFADPLLSNQELIQMLPLEYTRTSRASRVSKSRRIIREGLAADALELIAASGYVGPETTRKANILLAEMGAT
jgi:hypothetical protein